VRENQGNETRELHTAWTDRPFLSLEGFWGLTPAVERSACLAAIMEDQSKKPKDNAFQQQRLKAWQPLLTPKWVISTFLCVGVLFLPIGVVLLDLSASVQEVEIQYDNLEGGNDKSLEFTLTEDWEPPMYVRVCMYETHSSSLSYVDVYVYVYMYMCAYVSVGCIILSRAAAHFLCIYRQLHYAPLQLFLLQTDQLLPEPPPLRQIPLGRAAAQRWHVHGQLPPAGVRRGRGGAVPLRTHRGE
jgi:hypothetical protein